MAYVPRLQTYKRQGVFKRWALRGLTIVLWVYLLSLFVQGTLARGVRVMGESMAPTIQRFEMVLTSPLLFGKQSIFGPGTWLDIIKPSRGMVVLLDPPYDQDKGFLGELGNASIELASLGTRHVFSDWSDQPVIRRIIALPGDTVLIRDGTVYVQPSSGGEFLKEEAAAGKSWEINSEYQVESWGDNGLLHDAPALILGAGEYYVLADRRAGSADSRIWGPVSSTMFRGQVLLRYWPLSRLGLFD